MSFLIPVLISFKLDPFSRNIFLQDKKNAQPSGLSVRIKTIAFFRNKSVPFSSGINDPSHSGPHATDGSRANHRHNHGHNATGCREPSRRLQVHDDRDSNPFQTLVVTHFEFGVI